MTDTKTLQDVRAEFAALQNVTEDQFEAALVSALADFDAVVGAQPAAPAAPTIASVVVSFTDGSSQSVTAPSASA